MTRPARLPLPTLLVGAVVALVLSGCAVATGRQLAGPGMTARMGHGAIECSSAAPAAGTRIEVDLMDMRRHTMAAGGGGSRMAVHGHSMAGMMRGRMVLGAWPRVVLAGQATLVAVNRGARSHELVVLPLAPHASVGRRTVGSDRAVDESTSLGEASRSCAAGEGSGLRPGTAGWVTLTLTPGRYELVCNRPGHYAHGMYTELVVR